MKKWIVFLPLLLLWTCQDASKKITVAASSGWDLVYKHDKNGQTIAGDKTQLIDAIRHGYSVRVGWGWERMRDDTLIRLEHMAEPIFLSIIREQDIAAVIDAHPLLENYLDIQQQTFREGGHIWQCVLSTTGTFNAKVYHRATGELLRDLPQRHHMSWFVEFPAHSPSNKSKPLFQIETD